MILDEFVDVAVNPTTIKHFEKLGYAIPKKSDGKIAYGERIIVKVSDLTKGSNAMVNVACDICGKKNYISCKSYWKNVNKNGYYSCFDCSRKRLSERWQNLPQDEKDAFTKKVEDSIFAKYGVKSTLQIKEIREKGYETNLKKYGNKIASQSDVVKEKVRNTCIEKYGVPYYFMTDEFAIIREEYRASHIEEMTKKQQETILKKIEEDPLYYAKRTEKTKQTLLQKYGADALMHIPEIRDKAHKTNMERYGGVSSACSPLVREKMRQTNLRKYGVENAMQNEAIRKKVVSTMYKNSSMKTSKQQFEVYNVYKRTQNCELNYPVSACSGDIVFLDDKIDFEIDYGGHWIDVVSGRITQEEFDQKELKRDKAVKSQGYKVVRLISRNSRLIPSESKLLEILSLTREYFAQYPNHTWINWNMDDSKRYDAEHKDGIPFVFGELQKAETKALS